MAENSRIEWTTHTFNPWRGCTRISPGCTHCYAETLSHQNPKVLGVWGDKGTRVIASEAMWREPLKWDKKARLAGERHRVFCASLADVFEDRPDLRNPRLRLWELIDATPNLDWLLLSKRPENFKRMLPLPPFVFPNVWLGVSVEYQKYADKRIPILVDTPAVVRFLSCEPLLGPVDLSVTWLSVPVGDGPDRLEGVDWVIVGGESGAWARPCRLDWVRSLLRQCKDAGVACFVKQLGAMPELCDGPLGYPAVLNLLNRKGGEPAEWPEDLRVREFPRAVFA